MNCSDLVNITMFQEDWPIFVNNLDEFGVFRATFSNFFLILIFRSFIRR